MAKLHNLVPDPTVARLRYGAERGQNSKPDFPFFDFLKLICEE